MADNTPSGKEYRTGRTDSTSSTSTTGTTTSAARSSAPATGQAAGAAGTSPTTRRSSHTLFEGLTAQKRRDDPELVARRQSLNEQRPQMGFIGQMWNNWVRGNK